MTIKASVNGNKVVTGECILSYPHLFKKSSFDENAPEDSKKFDAQFIFEKGSDTEKAFKQAVQNKKDDDKSATGKTPGEPYPVIRECKEGSGFEGKLYVKAKSKFPISVIDQGKHKIDEPEEGDDNPKIYAGAIVRAVIEVGSYEKNGSRSITSYLKAVQLVRDGERLGGGSSVELFDELIDDTDDFLA